MNHKKQLVISYFKMAGISFFAGMLTLACYNSFLQIFGSTGKTLFFSSFFAYVVGVIANFFMQALNGSHKPTTTKMLRFFAINILTAALTSVISTHLITGMSLNEDRVLINVIYCFIVVIISPFTFFLYNLTLKM